ncbi:putative hydantoin racemase protein [Oceanimonas sp. GK1]|uniref:aspartate/glutamate racemase family protein n=1 Tax=Oceanimonas sp. (strain GK1 / IBRC-M 10197) TaxID=511062 RepID=UPI0002494BC3|nr:aspartate/glutamate racemase family protein [Oceanimonas sp. GK1]AEY00009.1 putative hydantoin racemase protein [Oceanimonas sp. GK1]
MSTPACPPELVLINPNANTHTTAAMVALAQRQAGDRARVRGLSNPGAPALLTTPAEIAAAALGVIELGMTAAAEGASALVVAAFGDPGLSELRARVSVPVFGIAESAFHAAAMNGRRFGIATITPDADLLASFEQKARDFGYAQQYSGTRVTPGCPKALVRTPAALDAALAEAVRQAVNQDGATAVIIGGGPLTEAALRLQSRFDIPLIVPVLAATGAALAAMQSD